MPKTYKITTRFRLVSKKYCKTILDIFTVIYTRDVSFKVNYKILANEI